MSDRLRETWEEIKAWQKKWGNLPHELIERMDAALAAAPAEQPPAMPARQDEDRFLDLYLIEHENEFLAAVEQLSRPALVEAIKPIVARVRREERKRAAQIIDKEIEDREKFDDCMSSLDELAAAIRKGE